MGCGSMSEPHDIHTSEYDRLVARNWREMAVRRALRLALAQWADERELFDITDNPIGIVEMRTVSDHLTVLLPNGETFTFRIDVI